MMDEIKFKKLWSALEDSIFPELANGQKIQVLEITSEGVDFGKLPKQFLETFNIKVIYGYDSTRETPLEGQSPELPKPS